jgi:hypothetical protein
MLSDAGLQWKDVSRVLLVGGSTRMPMVPQRLRQMTGIPPDRSVNPDEAVARGAALYARYLLAKQGRGDRDRGKGPRASFEITNVNSHSLGVEGIDRHTLRKTNVVLIPRNSALPAKYTERFTTKSENQRSIVVQVLEGESSLPGECTAIGRTVIRDLPGGLPKGWPIEVTFEYAANGRLSVRAAVPGTYQDASLDLQRAVGLSDERINRWQGLVAASAGFGAFESAAMEASDARQPGGPTDSEQPPPPEDLPGDDGPPGSPSAETDAGPAADERDRPAAGGAGRWVLLAVGYLSSAIVGLGLGFLVLWLLSHRWPGIFSLPW